MTVTATQIKAVIDAALQNTNTPLRTYDYSISEKRRLMPYVLVTVPTKSEVKDVKKITYSQRFKLTFYVRQRGISETSESFQDTVEALILTALDGTVLAGDRLFTDQKFWTRSQKVVDKPIPHFESTLDVYVTDIQSTTGAGIIGARISVDLPGLAGIPLLNMPQSTDRIGTEDVLSDDLRRVNVCSTGHSSNKVFEIESTPARRTAIDTLMKNKAQVSSTIHRGADTETFNCIVTEMTDGAPYSDLETLIIRLEVFDS